MGHRNQGKSPGKSRANPGKFPIRTGASWRKLGLNPA